MDCALGRGIFGVRGIQATGRASVDLLNASIAACSFRVASRSHWTFALILAVCCVLREGQLILDTDTPALTSWIRADPDLEPWVGECGRKLGGA